MFDEQEIMAPTFYGMNIYLIEAAIAIIIALIFLAYNFHQDGVIRNLETQVKTLKGVLELNDEQDN